MPDSLRSLESLHLRRVIHSAHVYVPRPYQLAPQRRPQEMDLREALAAFADKAGLMLYRQELLEVLPFSMGCGLIDPHSDQATEGAVQKVNIVDRLRHPVER